MTDDFDKQLAPYRWIPVSAYPLLACLVGLVLAGLDISRLTGLWSCDIACQGGAHYQQVAGLSVVWPALLVHLLIAALAWRDFQRGGWCPWSIRLMWFAAGVSLFFLLIAKQLDLSCTYCHTIHLATFVLLGLATPWARTVRWWNAGAWLLAGWLVTNAVFHHAAVPDLLPPTRPQLPVTVEDVARHHTAEIGRTYGYASAPRTLEIVIDLTCRHCAEQYRPLMASLKPAIDAKRVCVIVRHLVRPSQPASRPAAELVVAAAAMGEHAVAMDTLLGSNPDAGLAGLKSRLGDVIDPVRLDATLTKNATTISLLIVDDQQRIRELGAGLRTPAAVLSENGKVTKQWSGNLPVTAIVSALDGAL